MVVVCAGCEQPIYDRYLFNVLGKTWHATCITCFDCKSPLNERCYERAGLIYCKEDFQRRFGAKCAGCDQLVAKTDLVRRARDKVFHVDCFCCSVCQKRLDTGEELYIVNGSKFICKQDYLACRSASSNVSEYGSDDGDEDELCPLDDSKSELEVPSGLTELQVGEGSPGSTTKSDAGANQRAGSCSPQKNQGDENVGSNGNSGGSQTGSKRRGPRTTIKAKQLETLKAAFAATPKPTRHIREQLAQETGLNMRVIQVWFQNRRSKERRMKQLRYGGYRPGRRSRGAMNRDDSLVAQHMFPDGIPRPGDAYYQHHLGYYVDMFGSGGSESGHPEMNLPPQSHPFLLQSDETVTPLEAHPPEAHFVLEEGSLRPPQASPDMPMGGEDAFRAQHAFIPKSESVMSVGTW